MKTLKEAKIERFGYKDEWHRISTLYQITYIWEKTFLWYTRIDQEKLPLLFRNESDAIDFIECGGRIKKRRRVAASLFGLIDCVFRAGQPADAYRHLLFAFPAADAVRQHNQQG